MVELFLTNPTIVRLIFHLKGNGNFTFCYKHRFFHIKIQLLVRPRGHKQKKLNKHLYSFILSLSSRLCYQVEFYYIKGTLLKNAFSYKATLLASVIQLKFQLNPFTPEM